MSEKDVYVQCADATYICVCVCFCSDTTTRIRNFLPSRIIRMLFTFIVLMSQALSCLLLEDHCLLDCGATMLVCGSDARLCDGCGVVMRWFRSDNTDMNQLLTIVNIRFTHFIVSKVFSVIPHIFGLYIVVGRKMPTWLYCPFDFSAASTWRVQSA